MLRASPIKKHAYLIMPILALLILLSFSYISYASEDLSPELQKEKEEFLSECEKNHYNSAYYNCACRTDAFIRERLKQPEQRYISRARGAISTECFDFESISKFEMEKCLKKSPPSTFRNEGIEIHEQYCQCRTDYIVEKLHNIDTVNMRNFHMGIQKTAGSECIKRYKENNNQF